jgi:hypothetical protein
MSTSSSVEPAAFGMWMKTTTRREEVDRASM